ncbi:MAG: plastocyanin/azurin family copper-binding protein [Gemmatimonadales bacterium]|nr:plastocyanin/azurin family copper-binding protein [Gemmatimonadales bacterium]MDZ4389616.1 plastocyanin/azurin family copper-binding protein [Gemmatimonadales bacterium]
MTNFIPALSRLAGCCLCALFIACGEGNPPAPGAPVPPAPVSATPAKTLRIEMTDQMTYAPIHPTIAVGDTVEWVNVGAMPHTATDFPGAAAVAVNQVLPDGAAPFDTESVLGGGTSRIVFTTPGEYTYLCIFHEGMKMVGRLTVK